MSERDPSEFLFPAVVETIASLDLQPEDAAMVKLCKHYAQRIDQAVTPAAMQHATRWLGPELQRVLESLGASPVARVRLRGGKPADEPDSPLRKLRSI